MWPPNRYAASQNRGRDAGRKSTATLGQEALLAAVGAAAIFSAYKPATCGGGVFSALFSAESGLVRECRNLRYEVAYEFRRAVDQFCDTIAQGHWALFVIVLVTVAAYVPSERGWDSWGVSRRTLRHGRLLSYQLAHANLAHLSGNMGTLLAVGSEVSEALDCDQLRLLALYVACGWAGGLASALLSEANTIGASGAVSGVIVALSTLRPNSAVHILGDVNAANPLMLLLGTLGADLARGRGISWQAHLGGGVAGCVIAWLYTLLPR